MNNVENGGFIIGDVVEFIDKTIPMPIDCVGIITHINENDYLTVLTKHGSDKWYAGYCKKTGRHFSEIDDMFKKMSWKTDLESIKTIVSAFLYVDVDETPFSPMVVQHPIFESGIQCVKNDDGETELINILESGENLERARRNISSLVEQAKTLNDLYMIIRKSYRLTFLRYAQDDLSLEDMSKLLRHAWTSSENPNDDVNVSLPMAISWFRRADKSFLMDEEDYNTYQSFGDETKVYRGVAVGRNPHGLSWTTDKSKAHWFAHRFDIEDKQGYIQSLVVKKDDILAYFSDRDESEVVVDTLKYLNEIEVVEE